MTSTIAIQITTAHIECARLNPHFEGVQAQEWVYQLVFGAYEGTEKDRRNMALCY